jgi:hypothetical protein
MCLYGLRFATNPLLGITQIRQTCYNDSRMAIQTTDLRSVAPSDMVKPISLRLRHGAILQKARAALAGSGRDLQLKQSRNTAILRKAHTIIAQARERDQLRRCAKLAAFKAIAAVRDAYDKIILARRAISIESVGGNGGS